MRVAAADKEVLDEGVVYNAFSGSEQLAGYQKKRDFTYSNCNLCGRRDTLQYSAGKRNSGRVDTGGNRRDASGSGIYDTGGNRCGRLLDPAGTWSFTGYGNLCSDAVYWIFSGSILVRDLACDPKAEQENGDTAGTFFVGWIYRGTFYMRDFREIKKGSFTIEAACVMSLVLLVLMGVLYLSFFVHNRAWLTAAACEAALTGSLEGVRKDGQPQEAATVRSRELGNVGFFGAENLSGQVKNGKEIKVTYTADTISGFGGFRWKLTADGSSKVIRPVEWIRKIRVASEVIEEIGG